jgi:hypothetical protein
MATTNLTPLDVVRNEVKDVTDADLAGIPDSMPFEDIKLLVSARIRARKQAERKATRSNEPKGDNATYNLLNASAESMITAAETYVTDDGKPTEKLLDYVYDLADAFQALTSLDSTQMAANFRVKGADIARMVRKPRTRPVATTPAE